ncbi:dihydrofolate reductase family protein [Synechococcus sp. Nb3U1]|uniref:RibD family protein n=1 Tax=Synechococcus sp. Nb3U1 TaxID=1914529 RepID=UPI001F1584BF|nr:dihydrofolate reductase family protein [Synechococcus sp. Nb3U1]MCF2971574.1 dihydrofolate reductase family protein [Synechococcus sp. Nb3U1]
MKASRPHLVAIFAQSLDGKIASDRLQRPSFGSREDYRHLETQAAQQQALIMGAATLRAYGTSLRLRDPELLRQRVVQGLPPQPLTIICSASGELSPDLPFFRQPLTRWLWTTPSGAGAWPRGSGFEEVWVAPDWDLPARLLRLKTLGFDRVGVLGGGRLLGAFLQAQALDELWVTLAPVLLSGYPDPPASIEGWQVEGSPPQLELLECRQGSVELFLRYRLDWRNP